MDKGRVEKRRKVRGEGGRGRQYMYVTYIEYCKHINKYMHVYMYMYTFSFFQENLPSHCSLNVLGLPTCT